MKYYKEDERVKRWHNAGSGAESQTFYTNPMTSMPLRHHHINKGGAPGRLRAVQGGSTKLGSGESAEIWSSKLGQNLPMY